MNGLELLADEIDGRLHVAICRRGVLENLYADRRDRTASWGSLYHGKIIKVDAKLDAAFVDLGNGLTGFLPAKHVHLPGADSSERRTGIADLLKPGQMLLVQIKAEAKMESLHDNHKLPRLTTKLYVFGQCLVYSPSASQVTISRRIVNEDTLKFTTKLKGRGGWIVQPGAEKTDEDTILFEANALLAEWQIISALQESGGGKPGLLRAGPNAVMRVLCDYSAFAFEHVHAGNRKILDDLIAWSERFYPALANSKRLRLFKPEPQGAKTVFDMYDIHGGLEAATAALVPLPSGGSITIETTHAMVVIDVNQGSGPVMAANMEAVDAVVKQVRMRNLSGAILVDFINMSMRNDRSRLVDTLTSLLADDNAGAEVHGFTRIGIVEMTRKRRTGMLAEKLKS